MLNRVYVRYACALLLALTLLGFEPIRAGDEPQSNANVEPVIRASELPLRSPTVVADVKGVVRITRNGGIVRPSVGDSTRAGDLVQVAPNSSLTLKSARGVVTLTSRDGEWFKFVH